jgi:hypothetical protein
MYYSLVLIGCYNYGMTFAILTCIELIKTLNRRRYGMKRFLMIGLAVLLGLSLVTTVFAQTATEKATKATTEKAAPAPEKVTQEKAAPEKAPAPKKQAAKAKAKAPGFQGKVTAVDATKIAVKGKKGQVTFDASNPKLKGYKAIGDVKVGDTVTAKYTKDGVMITKLKGAAKTKAVGEKKAKKAKKAAPAPAK